MKCGLPALISFRCLADGEVEFLRAASGDADLLRLADIRVVRVDPPSNPESTGRPYRAGKHGRLRQVPRHRGSVRCSTEQRAIRANRLLYESFEVGPSSQMQSMKDTTLT